MPARGCPQCRGRAGLRFTIDEARIRSVFMDNGMAAPEIHALARAQKEWSQRFAPRRTGRLARLHYIRMMPGTVEPSRKFYIGTSAGYARFLKGTTGPILPKKGPLLELRPLPYSYFTPESPGRFRKSVAGQPPHPRKDWLIGAARVAFDMARLNPGNMRPRWNSPTWW